MRFIPNSLTRESRFVTFTRFRRTTKCKVWGCNGIFIRSQVVAAACSPRMAAFARSQWYRRGATLNSAFAQYMNTNTQYACKDTSLLKFLLSPTFILIIRKTIDGWRRGYVCQNYVSFVCWSISLIETMYQMLFSRFITFIECSASVWLHLSDAL